MLTRSSVFLGLYTFYFLTKKESRHASPVPSALIPANSFFFNCIFKERLAGTASLYLLIPLAFTLSLPTYFFPYFFFLCVQERLAGTACLHLRTTPCFNRIPCLRRVMRKELLRR